jgi:hypothetical protein
MTSSYVSFPRLAARSLSRVSGWTLSCAFSVGILSDWCERVKCDWFTLWSVMADEIDRPDRVLVKKDRQYIEGELSQSEGTEATRRSRIRDRIKEGLHDFSKIRRNESKIGISPLADDLREPDDSSEDKPYNDVAVDNDLYINVVDTAAFIYRLVHSADRDEDEFFEEAIQRARPFANEVDVTIKVEEPEVYNPHRIKEKIESNELPTKWETAMLFYHDDLDMEATFGEETKTLREWIPEFFERRDIDEDYFRVFGEP